MDEELLLMFIDESKGFIADIESDLLRLESEGAQNPDCVNRIFRAVHTIKGSGSILQLRKIVEVSHGAESLLCQIRDGQRSPTSQNVSAILQAVDVITEMLNMFDLGETQDYSALIELLNSLVKDKERVGTAPASPVEANVVTPPVANNLPAVAPQEPPATDADTTAPTALESKPAPEIRQATPATPQPAARQTDPTMRVPASVLNHLLQITGGMVMARNQLLNTSDQPDNPSLARLSRLISEVHETVIKTRKGNTGSLFNRFNRVVRDLCITLGKEANLIIEGGDLELDRSIIESFSDPMNSVRDYHDRYRQRPAIIHQLSQLYDGSPPAIPRPHRG